MTEQDVTRIKHWDTSLTPTTRDDVTSLRVTELEDRIKVLDVLGYDLRLDIQDVRSMDFGMMYSPNAIPTLVFLAVKRPDPRTPG